MNPSRFNSEDIKSFRKSLHRTFIFTHTWDDTGDINRMLVSELRVRTRNNSLKTPSFK